MSDSDKLVKERQGEYKIDVECIDNLFVSSDNRSKTYRVHLPASHGHRTQTAMYHADCSKH